MQSTPVTSPKKKSATQLRANSQLGMNHRTASHILNRNIFYSLLVETGRDSCLRCATPLTPENYSIEHIEEWLDSDNPELKFHSLNNIDFVCKKCNSTYNRGRIDVRRSGVPLVKPLARPLIPLFSRKVSYEKPTTHSGKTLHPFLLSILGWFAIS